MGGCLNVFVCSVRLFEDQQAVNDIRTRVVHTSSNIITRNAGITRYHRLSEKDVAVIK